MPTYDYECSACGHRFEKFQSITARPIRKCPVCGRSKVRRLIGAGAGVIFRGSGFYQTDYRSASYRKAAEKDKGAKGSKGSEAKGSGDGAGKGSSGDTSGKPADGGGNKGSRDD